MIRKQILPAACLAVVMVFGSAFFSAAFVEAAGAPKTVVKRPKHDFGSVYAGADIMHTFYIENAGDAPLALKSVRSG